ncbi:MAG: TIGR00266 family protein [Candidatus Bathyarchaeota archaeon]|nr:TIGR00266 family protein [Candidatus Termiticorpusculum sp.]
MKFEVKYKPSYAMLVASLSQGETITAEAGAMTYMDSTIEVHTRAREKSLLGSLGLSIIGGQSFWVNDYTATKGPGDAAFVAAPVGDIERLDVAPGKGYVIQKSAYIASTPDINLDVKWEGFTKGIFGQGLFMLKATGNGPLFINTFGAIDAHTLQAGQTLIVDNFHLVGFSDTCNYKVTKFGGLKETLLSGEGLVTQITGPGNVYIQTKNLKEFTEWLWTVLGPKVRNTHAR